MGGFFVVFREYLVRFVSPNRRAILHKVHTELCITSKQTAVALLYKYISFYFDDYLLQYKEKYCSYIHLCTYSAFRFGTGDVYVR